MGDPLHDELPSHPSFQPWKELNSIPTMPQQALNPHPHHDSGPISNNNHIASNKHRLLRTGPPGNASLSSATAGKPPSGTTTTAYSSTSTATASRKHKSSRSYDAELLDVLHEFRRAKARRSSLPQGVGIYVPTAIAQVAGLGALGGGGLNGFDDKPRSVSAPSRRSNHEHDGVQDGEGQVPSSRISASNTSSSTSSLTSRSALTRESQYTHSRPSSRSRPRSTPPVQPSSSTSSRVLLSITTERLLHERNQRIAAEHECSLLIAKVKTLHDSQLALRRELDGVRQELGLYKIQLDFAQKEILRAQEIVNEVDQQRVAAEQQALRNREKVRRMVEERVLAEALEEGRRAGYREGLEHAKAKSLAESRSQAQSIGKSNRQDAGDGEHKPTGRPRRNTVGSEGLAQETQRQHQAQKKRSESATRPSTSSTVPPPPQAPSHNYSSRSKTPLDPTRIRTPFDPMRSRTAFEPARTKTPFGSIRSGAATSERVPDTGHFSRQLPVPVITTPQPVDVPSTQPQPTPERMPESIEILSTRNSPNGSQAHSVVTLNQQLPRVVHPEVHLPPDGFIPTLNPADNSIALPPPHELSLPVALGRDAEIPPVPPVPSQHQHRPQPDAGKYHTGAGRNGATRTRSAETYRAETPLSSKAKGKTPIRGGPDPEEMNVVHHPRSSSRNGARSNDPRRHHTHPTDDGQHEDYFGRQHHSAATGYTNPMGVGNMYNSTPRSRRERAESVTSFGASTRISHFDIVSPPSPSPSHRAGGSVHGSDTDEHSFGYDFLAHNQRRQERNGQGSRNDQVHEADPRSQLHIRTDGNSQDPRNERGHTQGQHQVQQQLRRHVTPQTPETPTPLPVSIRSRPRAQTQPQEMAAYWRSKNADALVATSNEPGSAIFSPSSSSQRAQKLTSKTRERGGSISSRLGSSGDATSNAQGVNGANLQRPKTSEPRSHQRPFTPREHEQQSNYVAPVNHNNQSANNAQHSYGTDDQGALQTPSHLQTPVRENVGAGKRVPIYRSFASGTTPDIGVEPPSQSPTDVSGVTIFDPVLLTPDAGTQLNPQAPTNTTSGQQQLQQHQHNLHVGYYMAPAFPNFQYTATGVDVKPSFSYSRGHYGDKPPGFVVPLSPIPSLSDFRTSVDDSSAPIYGRPSFDPPMSTAPDYQDRKHDGGVTSPGANSANRPKDVDAFGNGMGFFSPAPLNRPISLFSDME